MVLLARVSLVMLTSLTQAAIAISALTILACERDRPALVKANLSPLPVGIELTPSPTPALARFAPPGICYSIAYFSVTTPTGITGIPPGKPLKVLGADAAQLHLTDGSIEFDVSPDKVTNDLALAASARIRDAGQQRAASDAVAAMTAFTVVLPSQHTGPHHTVTDPKPEIWHNSLDRPAYDQRQVMVRPFYIRYPYWWYYP